MLMNYADEYFHQLELTDLSDMRKIKSVSGPK